MLFWIEKYYVGGHAMSVVLDFIKKFPLQRAIMELILFAICLITVKIILIVFDKCFKKSKMDELIYKISRVVLKAFLLFTVVIIMLSSLGISVSSLVAAISIIGVVFSYPHVNVHMQTK